MSVIKALDKTTVHHICSGQVIISLANAVKELIENSLDAGAKTIEVKLKQFGSEAIEVIDDGPGVEESEFETITRKHYTSKIAAYDDLETLTTFGFRGEALNSLCALAKLTIITRHKNAINATRIEYDSNSEIKTKKPCARSIGTTVILENLFYTLPVRHKEFTKNLKKEYNKLLNVIQAYCLISDGIKLSCFNIVTGKCTKLMSTHSKNVLKDNIIEIFGITAFNTLFQFEQVTPNEEVLNAYKVINLESLNENLFQIDGYISTCEHGQGRSAPDRQYLYINKRPCENSRINKLINEIYHQFNRTQYPMFILNINLNSKDVDVNVTPDKLQMFIKNENILLAILKMSLSEAYNAKNMNMNIDNSRIQTSFDDSFKAFKRVDANTERIISSKPKIDETIKDVCSEKPVKLYNNEIITEKKVIEQKLVNDPIQRLIEEAAVIDTDTEDEEVAKPEKLRVKAYNNENSISRERPQNALTLLSYPKEAKSKEATAKRKILTESESSSDSSDNSQSPRSHSRCPKLKQSKLEDTFFSPKNNARVLKTTNGSENLPKLLFQNNIGANKTVKEINMNVSLSDRLDLHYGKCNDYDSPKRTTLFDGLKTLGCNKSYEKVDHDLDVYEEEVSPSVTQMTDICVKSTQASVQSIRSQAVEKAIETSTPKTTQFSSQKSTSTPTVVMTKEMIMAKRKVKTIDFNFDIFKQQKQSTKLDETASTQQKLNLKFKCKNLDSKNAESELDRCLKKENFAQMKVCGQFNKGFIITQFEQDLFIVDQHAADEIYNFEQLQKTEKIERQRLLQPHYLELSVSSESLLIDNLGLLEKAGYEVQVVNNRKIGNRIMLTCVPLSRQQNRGFDLKDIDELLFILNENNYSVTSTSSMTDTHDDCANGLSIKPSSLRALYASKACRKSIMIGDSLNKFEMKRVVTHLSEIDKPWNCPHGRPTLRHLINLNLFKNL